MGRVMTFAADTPVLNLGQEQQQLFYLIKGRVAVMNLQGGRMQDVAHIEEGRFFGEIGFFTGHTSTVSLRAAVASEVWTVNRADFDQFLDANPTLSRPILEALLTSLCHQLCFTYEKIGALSAPGRKA